MAFDNEGASWLQLGDEILNPYFGSKMLHCGDVRARHPSLEGGKLPPARQTPKATVEPLAALFQTYLGLQETLAADDDAKAKTEAEKLVPTINAIDMKQFEGALHEKWMALLPKLKDASAAVHSAGEIKARRKAFEDLSNIVLELVDRFGNPTAEPLYKAHCPMAFDNKGADWLQRGETINNPYYGAMMLRCGGLKKTYTARVKAQKPTPPVDGKH
jgi:Cu(I)/Ag(I) efflux system membrane fusion protein